LCILAAAVWEILALALAWARRTVARLSALPRGTRGPAPIVLAVPGAPPSPPPAAGRRSRAPPAPLLVTRRAVPVAQSTSRRGSGRDDEADHRGNRRGRPHPGRERDRLGAAGIDRGLHHRRQRRRLRQLRTAGPPDLFRRLGGRLERTRGLGHPGARREGQLG